MIRSLFVFAFILLSLAFMNNSFAIAQYMESCDVATIGSGQTGIDGSHCSAGLVCDTKTALCAKPEEVK